MTMVWTRREFLTRTVGGLAVAGVSSWEGWRDAQPIRAGIIGLGSRGCRYIAAGLLPGVALTRLCDTSPRALTAAGHCCAQWLGQSVPGSTSADDLLSDPALDLVVVAAPRRVRARLAAAALAAGKHVYCEPPWTTSAAESDALLSAAARAGRLIWQGCAEPAWPPHVVANFFKSAAAGDDVQFVLTRRAGLRSEAGSQTPSSWDVAWLDVLAPLTSALALVPDVRQAIRIDTPFGERGDVICESPHSTRRRIVMTEQRGDPSPLVSEWDFEVRTDDRSAHLWLGLATRDAPRPDPIADLASWTAFLNAIRSDDVAVWRRIGRQAHQATTWFYACEQGWHRASH
jgi:hypothetical protein